MKKLVALMVVCSMLFLLPNVNTLAQSQSESNASRVATNNQKPYAIATINAKGEKKVQKTYATFAEANKNFQRKNNLVILYKNNIIKMYNGIVVAKTPSKGGITHIYPNANLVKNKHITGVAYGNELEYISSDDKSIKIKYAGQEGYVSHNEAYLLPMVMMNGKSSYYQIDSARNITHVVYNHISKTQESYFYGKAPVSVKAGNYTSWDGINFTSKKDGKKVGPFYQYFNILPFRTVTNYSAAELDAIIMKQLKAKEAESKAKKNTTYLNASKKSKLIGLGKTLKNVEKEYRVNALMILAQAIHESNYGMSGKAQKDNNLFGIGVYDENPVMGQKYKTVQDSIVALVKSVLNPYYIPANGGYANGSHLGNKYRGVNVRYASDQYWGQKIAGHLYILDKEMGGKDFIKNKSPYVMYQIVSTRGLNVRSTPEINDNRIYRYEKDKVGIILATLSKTVKPDYTWYKIVSDRLDTPYGYVASADETENLIKILPIAK